MNGSAMVRRVPSLLTVPRAGVGAGRWRATARDAMAAAMAVTVAWNLYGFADNFFERAWAGAPIPVTPVSYALNAALVAMLPLSRGGGRRTAAAAAVLGGLMAVWSAGGLFFLDGDVGLGSRLPAYLGPGVPAVLGTVVAAFGVRAYRGSA